MFNVSTWKLVSKENIVRVFPKLNKKEFNESNESYFKQMVLLHVPWRREEDLKPDTEKSREEIYNNNGVEHKVKSAYKITMQDEDKEDEDEFELDDNLDDDYHFDIEFLSSRLGPQSEVPTISLGNRQVDLQYNWHEAYQKKYQQYGSIPDFENFIDGSKKCPNEDECIPPELPEVQLSEDQQSIIDVVKMQIAKIKMQQTDCNENVKRIIIQGKAGM